MQLDDQLAARMWELAVYHRASLIGNYQDFGTGKIEEGVQRDVMTLTAFIDATAAGAALPDDICPECLCHLYTLREDEKPSRGHGWRCSRDPNTAKERAP